MKRTMITIATAFILIVASYIFGTQLAAFGAVNLNSSKSNIYKVGNDTYVSIDTNLPYAPMAVSENGNNVYVVWWTNKTGDNWEVMFRASNDGGATFRDKINLSNSPDADSQNAQIVAAGENSVFVSWWETNAISRSSESVLRVSTDAGQTFGPVLNLGGSGIISSSTSSSSEGVTTETTTSPADQAAENATTTTTTEETTGIIGPETSEIQGDAAVNTTDTTTTTTTTEETAGITAAQEGEPIPDIDVKLGCKRLPSGKCL
jgi:hypothetical protein